MKFSLFVHMERVSADEPQQRLYEEMLELCQIADENGMHAIWTGEHHGMDFTIAPNPFLNLVDLARRTKNVRLGHRQRGRPVLASDPSGRRGRDGRYHHGRQA